MESNKKPELGEAASDHVHCDCGLVQGKCREGMLAEYNALRNEILARLHDRQQILTFSIVTLGALLTISSSSQPESLITLAYPVISMFFAMGWSHNDLRIGEIGEYIQSKLEPCLPCLRWETYLEKRRAAREKPPVFDLRTVAHAIGVFVGGSVLSIVMSLPRIESVSTVSPMATALFVIDAIAIPITYFVIQRRRARPHLVKK